MAKGKADGTVPTDREASFLSRPDRGAGNLEERKARAARAATVGNQEDPSRVCAFCSPFPPLVDPRGTHECARCRRVMLPECKERRDRERAAERERRKGLEAMRP